MQYDVASVLRPAYANVKKVVEVVERPNGLGLRLPRDQYKALSNYRSPNQTSKGGEGRV